MPAEYIGQNLYIRPSYIVSLPEYYSESKFSSAAFQANQVNLEKNSHAGTLSRKACGALKNAINWMLCAADTKRVFHKAHNRWFNFKVAFITLTLPDTSTVITEKDFQKKLLNPWLTYMRSYHGLKNYVWKMEFQANGKLHCHITFDVFVHWRKIRTTWNKLLGANGYLADFSIKFGHADPNSTDVHSIRNIRNLGAYLAKYMSKSMGPDSGFKGRIWSCNYELSRANKTKMFVDRDAAHIELKPLMNSAIPWKPIGTIDKYTNEFRQFGETFYLQYTDWLHQITGPIKEAFNTAILELKNITAGTPQVYEV